MYYLSYNQRNLGKLKICNSKLLVQHPPTQDIFPLVKVYTHCYQWTEMGKKILNELFPSTKQMENLLLKRGEAKGIVN